jgi:flagellar hook-length control protein FliK
VISIINTVMASPTSETPAPVPNQGLQTDSARDSFQDSGFADKLKDCEETEEQTAETVNEDEKKKDNGRHNNSNEINAYGIVGILEGFGSLSYQSDGSPTAEIMPDTSGETSAVNIQQAGQETLTGTPETGTNAENGLSGQIAWMLQTNDAGTAPVQTQDEILKTIGEYLDSLENTSTISSETEKDAQTHTADNNSEIILNAQANNGSNLKIAVKTVPEETESETESLKLLINDENPEKFIAAESAAAEGEIPEEGVFAVKQGAGKTPGVAERGTENTDAEEQTANAEGTGDTDKSEAAGSIIAKAAAEEDSVAKAQAGKQEGIAGTTAKAQKEVKSSASDNAVSANAATDAQVSNQENKATVQAASEAFQEAAEGQNVGTHLKENITRIVDSIRAETAEGKYKFDIQLKPDFLGKVNIRISMKDNDLKVQIKTDDITVKGMLSDQTSSLLSIFKEKGINVTNIDISYDSPEMQNSEGQTHGQQSGGYDTGGNLNYEPAADEDSFNSAVEQYNSYLGDSYIEFYA